jgi:Zn finger protein HypA/HybF involved in hydrogenase expression
MHEWKITEAIIEEILKQAEANGVKKINKVILSIGKESDLTGDEIRFCFDALKSNYPLGDLELQIKQRDGMGGVIIEEIEGED